MKNRIGIIGGGQLGRMMTGPAHELGFAVSVLDPTPDCPAAQVGAAQIIGTVKDAAAIRQLAKVSDFITFEIELADAELLDELSTAGAAVNPSATTLGMIKDKLRQKTYLAEHNLPVARFRAVESPDDIGAAIAEFGLPIMLKARRDSYDGRGNVLIESADGIAAAMEKLSDRELYVEEFVDFARELAVMAARSTEGEIRTYPVVETIHERSILQSARVPAAIDPEAAAEVVTFATQLMEHLGGAGVYGIELFQTKDGKLLINEIAPRVHNSGHYSIEACGISQFEQHIRAVTGLPLGPSQLRVPAAVMVNILGDRTGPAALNGLREAAAIPGAAVHIYGKAETRPDRKMGHVTAVGDSLDIAAEAATSARRAISI